MLAKWCSVTPWPPMAHVVINSQLFESDTEIELYLQSVHLHVSDRARSDSPLGVEDAVEGGSPPVLARQREDGPQVVEGDVTLGEGALQPGFLEGGPLLLQGPGTTQIPLREDIPGLISGWHGSMIHSFFWIYQRLTQNMFSLLLLRLDVWASLRRMIYVQSLTLQGCFLICWSGKDL